MPESFTPLEVTKILVDVLTPLMLLVLGIWVNGVSKKLEHSQWANQKLIEKRLAIYDQLAPKLNDLLCFCTFVGGWQTMDPPAMRAAKRELDRTFHIAAPLFSQEFTDAYNAYLATCFDMWGGHGQEARFKTGLTYRQQHLKTWRPEWASCFTPSESATKQAVRDAYRALMAQFSIELGLPSTGSAQTPRRPAPAPAPAGSAGHPTPSQG